MTIERTDRLRARPVTMECRAEFRLLYGDPRVAKTLTADGKPLDADGAETMLTQAVGHRMMHGFGLWIFEAAESGEFVGRGGLIHRIIEGVPEVEVAWAVRPDFWGRGFATEMGVLSVRIAFEDLALVSIVARTLTTNVASRRVMEKLGLTFEKDIRHVDLPHVLYRLRKTTTMSSDSSSTEIGESTL